MAATYRRVNMKALARYQIILLGEQRHIGVNNLPKVVARQCCGQRYHRRPIHCQTLIPQQTNLKTRQTLFLFGVVTNHRHSLHCRLHYITI